MTKEQAKVEALELVAANKQPDGYYRLNADMLKTVVEIAFMNGETSMLISVPDLINKAFESATKGLK